MGRIRVGGDLRRSNRTGFLPWLLHRRLSRTGRDVQGFE